MSSLAYVTLEEAKRQLRIVESDVHENDHIEQLIAAASGAVKNYLKDFSPYEAQRNADDDYLVDSNYEPLVEDDSDDGKLVKPEVKQAVLLLIAEWYRNREGDGAVYVHHVLPAPVMACLYGLRDPAVA